MSTASASTPSLYLQTKIMTASPEELRLMLLDGALKFTRQAREGLVNRHYEQSFTGFDRARAILLELISSVRPEVDPELCNRVSSLYTFLYGELVGANLDKDVGRVDRVLELLEFERETWVQLMQRLAEERSAARATQDRLRDSEQAAPQPGQPAQAAVAQYTPISLEG